jgi:hypothetical protein
MTVRNRLLDMEDPAIGGWQSTVRFDLLDQDCQWIGTLETLTADTVTNRTGAGVNRTLSGVTLEEGEFRSINPYVDRVRPTYVLEDGTEWPLGAFMFVDAPVERSSFRNRIPVTLEDQGAVLQYPTTSSLSVGVYGSIMAAIDEVLDAVHIQARSFLPPTTEKVWDPVTWPFNTPRRQIIDELAALAGFLPLWFDNHGFAQLTTPPDVVQRAPDHVYELGATSRVKSQSIVQNDNLLVAPNVYVVSAAGLTQGEVFGKAYVDPWLPWSVENRGFEVPDIYQAQGVGSTVQAQMMAEARAAMDAVAFKQVTFEAVADPRHDTYDVVQFDGFVYREVGWSLKLRPGGTMSHQLVAGGFGRLV